MKRIFVVMIYILAMVLILMPTVSADMDGGQPAGDDIFFNGPGGSEYTENTGDQESDDAEKNYPDIDWNASEPMSRGTVALISASALVIVGAAGIGVYCLLKKKKK